MPSQEASSTMLMVPPADVNTAELKLSLEKGDIMTKIATLKKMIAMQLNGEPMSMHIMTVMKYCLREDNHTLKKLLLYFWEVVDKVDASGNSLPEMIMICDAIRSDLQHPNEYVRGMTLRFLCKIKERELFEPLTSAVLANLTHRVSYVRRNAVLAVHTIYQNCPMLMPDAPETIEKFIAEENDVSARRNAFNFLVATAQDRAVRFLQQYRESNDMNDAGDVFQLAILDFIKTMIAVNPYEKSKYVPLIFAVMQSKNPAVSYQCATTLLRLSSSPTAIKHAAQIFVGLLTTHSDANVRLIALDRLKDMRRDFPEALQESLMEIVRGLNTANADLRQQVLNLTLDLVTAKTVEAYVQTMKKELVKSQADSDSASEAQQEYRQSVVKAIHSAVSRHLSIAPAVIPTLLDYVCEAGPSSYDVIVLVREVMQKVPEIRGDILQRLVSVFPLVTSAKTFRTILWLFGIHCTSIDQIRTIVAQLRESLAPLPLMTAAAAAALSIANVADTDAGAPANTPATTTTVREDGTYGQALTVDAGANNGSGDGSRNEAGIRAQIVSGDFFLAATLANTLAKLVVRAFKSRSAPQPAKEEIKTEAIAIIHELVTFGLSGKGSALIDNDSHERIRLALTVANNPVNEFLLSFVEDSQEAYNNVQPTVLAGGAASADGADADGAAAHAIARADAPIVFAQLNSAIDSGMTGAMSAAADDVLAAVANDTIDGSSGDGAGGASNNFMAKLHRVRQLSGFNDPVYIEAAVTVHHYDVLLEWTIVNQTKETLSNLCIEVAAMGDMKLCDRPQYLTVAPFGTAHLKTSLKVSSTETGIIYGSCLFDSPTLDRKCVILNEINVDIIDYIKPATTTIQTFRSMWSVFEWENKIMVSTDITDLWEFIERITAVTNMKPLDDRPEEDCGFLSSSLYARSVFGEDALAHASLERTDDGRIEGVVRIRSKTQAIALGLGEKLSKRQRLSSGPAGSAPNAAGAGAADALKHIVVGGGEEN